MAMVVGTAFATQRLGDRRTVAYGVRLHVVQGTHGLVTNVTNPNSFPVQVRFTGVALNFGVDVPSNDTRYAVTTNWSGVTVTRIRW